MLFSTKTILESRNNTRDSINNIDIKERSYFIEALDLLLDEEKQYAYMISSFDNGIINESIGKSLFKSMVKKIDFKKVLLKILNGFMEVVNKIFGQFKAFMLNLFGKDKVIKHYKTQLESYDSTVYFPEDRYIYTYLDDCRESTLFKNQLDDELSTLLRDLSEINNCRSLEDIDDVMKNKVLYNSQVTDSYFENIRCLSLGRDSYDITEEEYYKELFGYFRNKGIKFEPSEVNGTEVQMSCKRYFNSSNILKLTEKENKNIKEYTEKLKSKIMNIKLEDYVKDTIPQEYATTFVKALRNRCTRIDGNCQIYTQYFTAKLDAIKESHIQDKKLLTLACKQLVKGE